MVTISYMKLALPSIFSYKRRYLKHDLLAGLMVTAVVIPQSLAFATIIGVPPVNGLYTALVAPLVFALFASTRRLVVGPDSATTVVLAAGATVIAQAGTAAHVNAVLLIALIAGLLLLLMAVFRFGFLAELISRPVLIGFLAGIGVQLIVTSLPTMLGLTAQGNVWQQLSIVTQHLSALNGMTLTISILVVGIVIVLRRTAIPGELLGIVAAIMFSLGFHVETYGVQMVGALPNGLPQFTMPSTSIDQVIALLPAALSVALVVLAQGTAVIRSAAADHNEKSRLNQDLFSLGMANMLSALFHGFLANGSPTRTQVAYNAHGKAQGVNLVTAGLIAIVLLFGGTLFASVPKAALAAGMFVVGFCLIRYKVFLTIWQTHRVEFFVAIVATLGTLTFGVLQGVFIAVIVSLAERLSRQYHPKDAVLLKDGEFSEWAEARLEAKEGIENVTGIVVYRFEGSIFFENSSYFVTRLQRIVANTKEKVRVVVVDSGAINSIDYTAAEEIKHIFAQFDEQSVRLVFAHVTPELQRQFQRSGITELIGKDAMFPTLREALVMLGAKPRSTEDEKTSPKKPAKDR